MPTQEDLTKLVINKVDSIETFNKMKELGLIKEDEFYLISESPQSGGGGGTAFEVDETLSLKDGILSINTTDVSEEGNKLPVTSAAVQASIGNIDALLQTI